MNRLINRLCLAIPAFAITTATWADEIILFTTHGSPEYHVGMQANPDLTLKRGVTYQIELKSYGHPLWIKTKLGPGKDNAYTVGITGNGTDKGMITFVVPTSAPDRLFYNCEYHILMHGIINITD